MAPAMIDDASSTASTITAMAHPRLEGKACGRFPGSSKAWSDGSDAGDFDGRVHEVFARLGQTLAEAGGALGDMVTMTVFITDARLGDRFTELRRELLGDNFPASALITCAGLARPELLVEIQGIAVAN